MKIQLKRSNVLSSGAAKVPTASQLEYGELAVNYNTSDPAIFLKDSNNNIIRISGVGNISDDGLANVPDGTTPPANPEAGNLWYNSDQGRLYIYFTDADSSQWVDASPDSWDPSSYPDLTNSSAQSNTLDDRYAMLNGGNSFTGDLTIPDKIIHSADTNTAIRFPANDTVSVETAGNERLRIDSSGNMTIGGFNAGASNTSGAIISPSGQVNIQQPSGSSSNLITGITGTQVVSSISANGSATFAGTLTGVRTNNVGPSASSKVFAGYLTNTSGASTAFINANGSAVFGQAPNNSNATGVGILDPGGAIAVQANGKLFRGHAYSNGAETSAISDDGSATFRGNLVNGTATSYIGTYANTNNGAVLYGVLSNAEKWRISGDGSAKFNGISTPGATTTLDTSNHGVRIGLGATGTNIPGLIAASRDVDGTGVVAYFTGNAGGIDLKGDGSATFDGGVQSKAVNAYPFEVTNGSVNMGGLYRDSSGANLYIKNNAGQAQAYIKSDGQAVFNGTVNIGGSAAAHTIDEYEEGTFTPTIVGTSGASGQSYIANTRGHYVRVGTIVIASFYVELTNKGTLSGNGVLVGGFPYLVQSLAGSGAGSIAYFNNLGISVSVLQLNARAGTGQAYVNHVPAGGSSAMTNSSTILTNTTRLDGVVSYMTP